jgi:hypothetical protein
VIPAKPAPITPTNPLYNKTTNTTILKHNDLPEIESLRSLYVEVISPSQIAVILPLPADKTKTKVCCQKKEKNQ